MASLIAKNFEEKKAIGLKDDGHVILKCSSCNKPVFSLWIVNKKDDLEINYKASCPYCNGYSYTEKVKGKVITGGIPKNGDYYSDETDVLTFMNSFDIIDENGEAVVLFNVGKK